MPFVCILVRTQAKTYIMQLYATGVCGVEYLLYCVAEQLQRSQGYAVKVDCCEVCHIFTKMNKNVFQYQVAPFDTMEDLYSRQLCNNYDRAFIYLQISERTFPYRFKYAFTSEKEMEKYKSDIVRDLASVREILVQNNSDDGTRGYFDISDNPLDNVVNEMRNMYPLPLVVP